MDELLQPLAGRMLLELDGVDLFPLARAGKIAAVDPSADCGEAPVPVDTLEIGRLRFIPARRRVIEGVVDPTLANSACDAMLFPVPVVAEGVNKQAPREPFP